MRSSVVVSGLRISVWTTIFIACASAASPQAGPRSFADLPGALIAGTRLVVTDLSGERVTGKLREVSASSISVITPGPLGHERRWQTGEVASVNRIDSRLNGFVLGFLVGVVPGLLAGSVINNHCNNEGPEYCPGAFVYLGAAAGMAGGWIGLEIDDAFDRETPLYSRPPSSARRAVAPIATGAGLAFNVSF